MTRDPEQLRSAMRAWTTGVTVVTSVHDGQQHGMTVNSFTSISLDPALVTISLQNIARTRAMVLKTGIFGITVLATDQAHLSERFAGRTPDSEDRFAGLETETLVTGAPFIKGGLAWMDCRVAQTFDAGMSTLFIGEVVAVRGTSAGSPLVYHNRRY